MAKRHRRGPGFKVEEEDALDQGGTARCTSALLVNTTDDIQKNRHRKDPFGCKYLQLLQTPFEEVEGLTGPGSIPWTCVCFHVTLSCQRNASEAIFGRMMEVFLAINV